MTQGFLTLPWLAWAGLALVVALVYSCVWPQKAAAATTGIRFFILRWGHALTWLLLALNFVLRGISPSWKGAADLIALSGGLVYMLFIIMALVVK